MNYCKYCGAPIAPDAYVCPHCGRIVSENRVPDDYESRREEGSALGILAIVFGALGGFLGLLFGIIGLCVYRTHSNRKNCKAGIGLFFGWIVLIILFACLL